MTFFPANPGGRVKCFRYQPMAPGSLLVVLTSVMLMSCGTFVVVQAASLNAVASAPGIFPVCTFQSSSIRSLMRLLRYFASRRSVGVAWTLPATRKNITKSIETAAIVEFRIRLFWIRICLSRSPDSDAARVRENWFFTHIHSGGMLSNRREIVNQQRPADDLTHDQFTKMFQSLAVGHEDNE